MRIIRTMSGLMAKCSILRAAHHKYNLREFVCDRVSPNGGLANGVLVADLFRFLSMFLKPARYLASLLASFKNIAKKRNRSATKPPFAKPLFGDTRYGSGSAVDGRVCKARAMSKHHQGFHNQGTPVAKTEKGEEGGVAIIYALYIYIYMYV